MLTLFRSFVRWLRRDGVRAPHIPVEGLDLTALPCHVIEGGMIRCAFPFPTEQVLLNCLYQLREKDACVQVGIGINVTGEDIEKMLAWHRDQSERAETSVQPETKKHSGYTGL